MNLSGDSVKKAADFYKIKPKDILVIYDDIELNFGYIRMKKKGSAGTHNGMKSIIKELGTNEFSRLRLGVGPLPEKWDIKDYVLSNFNEIELNNLKEIFNNSNNAIKYWAQNNIEDAMQFYNKTNLLSDIN